MEVGCSPNNPQSFAFLLDFIEEYNWLVIDKCGECPYSHKYNSSDRECQIGGTYTYVQNIGIQNVYILYICDLFRLNCGKSLEEMLLMNLS